MSYSCCAFVNVDNVGVFVAHALMNVDVLCWWVLMCCGDVVCVGGLMLLCGVNVAAVY